MFRVGHDVEVGVFEFGEMPFACNRGLCAQLIDQLTRLFDRPESVDPYSCGTCGMTFTNYCLISIMNMYMSRFYIKLNICCDKL